MNAGMCVLTVRLSGPKSDARSQGRTEAKSYPQLVLAHKSVIFEKEADAVLHISKVPTASVTIEGASALNRVRWAQAGKEVAVGDSEGRIWIYDVGELAVPHNDEWTRFARTLVEIRANRADSEEEGAVELSA
ncbi:PREDICTED: cytoplasmic dynein 1 intermediate chain 1-like [Chlamydotis macqueenii]|uniref:cytoplasmic dynein 1 intermediate chain 1-like n=1 Tax=Chlamydotis macqueenii TaxID=187382 RepID=UPI000529D505|nr:PREDICTED: cytoplasmic dynein 1 intermediate chain 1-like [Chlamydotis macqueenii]